MASTRFTRSNLWRWALCLAGCAALALPARGQYYDPDWASHFRIGAIVGLNIKADFKLSGNLGVTHPAGVYDDGAVHPGQNPNYTSDWSYKDAGQYDSSAHTLTFTDTKSFALDKPSSTEANGGALPGFELAYGGNFWYWGRARIGWDSGIGFLPINISGTQTGLGGSSSQTKLIFNLPTDFVPPDAPYTGPPNGSGSPGSGYPYIPSKPGSTTNSVGDAGSISGTQTLDVMLYTVRIGPSVYWDFNRYLGMSVSAGPALGVMSGKLKYNETITDTVTMTQTRSSGQINGTDVVFGGYVNAMLMYHVVPNGDFYVGAQYMPLGTATISGGGREGQLKLGGSVYISAGINWPF